MRSNVIAASVVGLGSCLTLLECTPAPSELESGQSASTKIGATDWESDASQPTVSGYKHDLGKSLFDPGQNRTATSENGFAKTIGDFGVFSVDQANGTAMASRSSFAVRSRYTGTPSQHNAVVRAYFVNAGMPEGQLGDIQVNTLMRGGSSTADAYAGLEPRPEVVGFATSIGRQINGFVVCESIAWAEFGGDGKVTAETVYWPDVPQSVLDDAVTFGTMLGDAGESQAFRARLPGGIDLGRVVIHHSSMVERGAFEAIATYDAFTSDKHDGYTRHFDRNGTEIRLVREQAHGPVGQK